MVEDKCEAIRKALTYRFSSADVDKILASKDKFTQNPRNYAMTKAKLQKEREQHLGAGNQEEVGMINHKIFLRKKIFDFKSTVCCPLSG